MRIFVVTYGGGHVNSLIPVINELKYRNHSVDVLGATISSKTLFDARIPHYQFMHFADEEAIDIGLNFVDDIHTPGVGIPWVESVAYSGISMRDLYNQYGKERAYILYHNFGRRVFWPKNTLKEIIKKFTPDLVLTSNCPVAEEAARFASKELGIPTMAIESMIGVQNALPMGNRLIVRHESVRKKLVKYGYPKNRVIISDLPMVNIPREYSKLKKEIGYRYDYFADYISVMNDDVKSNLIKFGVTEDKIFITGQPAFDYLSNSDCYEFEDLLKIKNKRKIRLGFFDRITGTNIKEIYDLLLRILEKHYSCYELLIKLHPSDNGQIHRKLSSSYEYSPTIIDDKPLTNAIKSCDIVITYASTVIFEAVYLGVPVISVQLNHQKIPRLVSYFDKLDVITVAKNREQIIKILSDLNDEFLTKSIRNRNKLLHDVGNAANNIVDLIETHII